MEDMRPLLGRTGKQTSKGCDGEGFNDMGIGVKICDDDMRWAEALSPSPSLAPLPLCLPPFLTLSLSPSHPLFRYSPIKGGERKNNVIN